MEVSRNSCRQRAAFSGTRDKILPGVPAELHKKETLLHLKMIYYARFILQLQQFVQVSRGCNSPSTVKQGHMCLNVSEKQLLRHVRKRSL